MIYASDLDRTLIYSESFLDSYPDSNTPDKLLVDVSKVCSYIDKNVASYLGYLSKMKEIKFIPVTTRSIQEFKRIRFKEVGINFDYAITSNGGSILYRGKQLDKWQEYIKNNLDKNELLHIVNYIDSLDIIDYKSKVIDEVYVFSKYRKDLIGSSQVDNEINALGIKYPQYNIFNYKNKLYVIPKSIGKDIALNWIKQYLNEEKIIASGDSSFDLPMLAVADKAIIPGHTSLKDKDLRNCKYERVSSGIKSPLDTIKIIQHYVNNN